MNKFEFLLLLLIIGGILEAYDAYSIGIDMLKQTQVRLGSSHASHHALEAVRLGLQEIIPVTVGVVLAYLSPIIGVFEYLKIKKADVSETDQQRNLIVSRFKSLTIVSPVLIVLGLLVSLLSANLESTSQDPLDLLRFDFFHVPIVKGLIYGAFLATVGIIQIKLFFKWPKLGLIILVCFGVIILGLLGILIISFVLSKVF